MYLRLSKKMLIYHIKSPYAKVESLKKLIYEREYKMN